MPRPKTKAELIHLSNLNFDKLITFINSFDDKLQRKEFPKGTMNRNIRDVLAHLHHWHLMMLQWYAIGMSGQKPEMPAKGYTWKTTPDLNLEIWKKYLNEDLELIKNKLQESFLALQEVISNNTNEELFTKKKYKWTGTTSLASYLISATSSHYDWAYKLIKKAKK